MMRRLHASLLLALLPIGASTSAVAHSATPESDSPIILGVGYVGVTVSDLDAAIALYTKAAGLELVETEDALTPVIVGDHTGGGATTVLLRGSNAQLRLFEFEAPSDQARAAGETPVPGPGFAHVCYQADGETRTYETFLEGGATHVGGLEMATLNPRNPVRYAYARDPDGILFEVEHIALGRITNDRLAPGFRRIRHISLGTHDIERLVSFYGALMGVERPRRAGAPNGLSGESFDQVSGLAGTRMLMAWVPTPNLEIELTEYLSHPPTERDRPRPLDALGYNMVVFDVSDLASAKERLLAAGGTVETQPAASEGGMVFFGRDPDLNLLGFQLVAPDSPLSSARFRSP